MTSSQPSPEDRATRSIEEEIEGLRLALREVCAELDQARQKRDAGLDAIQGDLTSEAAEQMLTQVEAYADEVFARSAELQRLRDRLAQLTTGEEYQRRVEAARDLDALHRSAA